MAMDIESFTRREKLLLLRENLLAVEDDRTLGRKGCSIDELDNFLDSILYEDENPANTPCYGELPLS